MSQLEKNNYVQVNLFLLEYMAEQVDDVVLGSLALVRSSNDLFFVTSDVLKIEKQFEKVSGTFTLKSGGNIELLEMYLTSNEDLSEGDEFIDVKGNIISTYHKTFIGGLNHVEMIECTYGNIYTKSNCKKLYANTYDVANTIIRRNTETGETIEYPISINEIKEIVGGEETFILVNDVGAPILKENRITIRL